MNYWWTSDYHFSHANIIRYCNRPFETVEEMNETIIRKHNERVKPEDTVFFLGDFIFKIPVTHDLIAGGPEGNGGLKLLSKRVIIQQPGYKQ